MGMRLRVFLTSEEDRTRESYAEPRPSLNGLRIAPTWYG